MKPYPIVSKKGSMVTMNKGEREVTRDSSRFKPVSFDVPNDQTKEEDDEDPKVNLPPAFDEPKNLMKRKDEVNSINSYVAPQSQTEERIPIPQRKNPTEEPAEIKPQKVPYATRNPPHSIHHQLEDGRGSGRHQHFSVIFVWKRNTLETKKAQ